MQPPLGAQASPGLQQPKPGPHHVPLLQCRTWAWACAPSVSANAKADAATIVRATIVLSLLRRHVTNESGDERNSDALVEVEQGGRAAICLCQNSEAETRIIVEGKNPKPYLP